MAGERRRGDKASLTILSLSLLLSSLTHAHAHPGPSPTLTWNPARSCSCLCRAHRHSLPFPLCSVHFHHSRFLSLLIKTSISSFPTHSFRQPPGQSFPPRPPAALLVKESSPQERKKKERCDTRAGTTRQVRSRQSHSFRSSAPSCVLFPGFRSRPVFFPLLLPPTTHLVLFQYGHRPL